jgi:hypothetical protein
LPVTGNDRPRDAPKRQTAAGLAVSKKERELVFLEDAANAGPKVTGSPLLVGPEAPQARQPTLPLRA